MTEPADEKETVQFEPPIEWLEYYEDEISLEEELIRAMRNLVTMVAGGVMALAIMLATYSLSYGPAIYLQDQGLVSPNYMRAFYEPLYWVTDRCPYVDDVMASWAAVWRPEVPLPPPADAL